MLYKVLYKTLLIVGIVDRKIARIAETVTEAAKHLSADRMEGSCPYARGLAAESCGDSLLKLPCRLVGKGYGKYFPRLCRIYRHIPELGKFAFALYIVVGGLRVVLEKGGNLVGVVGVSVFDKICDPVDEDGGFSASRSRQHQKRAFGSRNRLELHIVHI